MNSFFIPAVLNPVRPFLLHSSVDYTELIPNQTSVYNTDSIMGHLGYKIEEASHPKDQFGHNMLLIAQINFADFDYPMYFPLKGLLQFYMSQTCIETNQNFQGILPQNNFKIVYIENPVKDPNLMDVEASFTSDAYPIKSALKLKFHNAIEPVSIFDYRFENYMPLDEISKIISLDDYNFEDFYLQHFSGAQHKIGGYPYFIQQDLRKNSVALQHYNILLLQLISNDEQGIMWGDCGVIKFFINDQDLQNLNFDNVILYVEDYT